MKLKLVCSVVECLEYWDCDQHSFGSKPTHVICCVLGKDTLLRLTIFLQLKTGTLQNKGLYQI